MNVIVTKHTTKTLVSQTQNMFPQDNASEIVKISQEYNFPLQICQTDKGEMYAVQDWIAGVAQTDNPRDFWRQIKKRLQKNNPELSSSCLQLPYKAANGKIYQMDYADGQTLYSITQRMGVDTGIRNKVLEFLAKSGAFIDAARVDPEQAEQLINAYARKRALAAGHDEAWVLTRELGKVTRKQLTALLMKISPNINIGIATNLGYQGTLGTDAKGLNIILGQKTGENPRDKMSRLALAYTIVNEEASRVRLQGYRENDILPEKVVYQELKAVSEATGMQARDMAKALGVDLITGKSLLGAGK